MTAFDALANLNQHFKQIHECLDHLEESGAFRGAFARRSIAVCRASLNETCAWINFEALQVLHDRAERDLARFERIRHRLEKALERPSKARR
jgi:hypothetical protein